MIATAKARSRFSPIINAEAGSPDLYFKINTPSGTVLLDEPKTQGQTPGRKNVGPVFCIEFNVEVLAALA